MYETNYITKPFFFILRQAPHCRGRFTQKQIYLKNITFWSLKTKKNSSERSNFMAAQIKVNVGINNVLHYIGTPWNQHQSIHYTRLFCVSLMSDWSLHTHTVKRKSSICHVMRSGLHTNVYYYLTGISLLNYLT